jgi:hypothetical protein
MLSKQTTQYLIAGMTAVRGAVDANHHSFVNQARPAAFTLFSSPPFSLQVVDKSRYAAGDNSLEREIQVLCKVGSSSINRSSRLCRSHKATATTAAATEAAPAVLAAAVPLDI